MLLGVIDRPDVRPRLDRFGFPGLELVEVLLIEVVDALARDGHDMAEVVGVALAVIGTGIEDAIRTLVNGADEGLEVETVDDQRRLGLEGRCGVCGCAIHLLKVGRR